MEYYWDKIAHDGDSLLISLAMTYDYDGNSNGATDIGIVATQLLDTPLATKPIDLNKDGIVYIQFPNLSINPFYSLMSDQFQFPTENSIKNVLK